MGDLAGGIPMDFQFTEEWGKCREGVPNSLKENLARSFEDGHPDYPLMKDEPEIPLP